MNALLTDRTTAKPPWAALRPSRAGLLNMVQKTLSALLARHLRRLEAELTSFRSPHAQTYRPRSQRDRIRADEQRTGAHKRRAAPAGSCKRRVAVPTKQTNPRPARQSVARRKDAVLPTASRAIQDLVIKQEIETMNTNMSILAKEDNGVNVTALLGAR